MSLQIPIQKDIGEYQEKIVGKMSLRTLACVSLGFASAIAAAAIVYFGPVSYTHLDVYKRQEPNRTEKRPSRLPLTCPFPII